MLTPSYRWGGLGTERFSGSSKTASRRVAWQRSSQAPMPPLIHALLVPLQDCMEGIHTESKLLSGPEFNKGLKAYMFDS